MPATAITSFSSIGTYVKPTSETVSNISSFYRYRSGHPLPIRGSSDPQDCSPFRRPSSPSLPQKKHHLYGRGRYVPEPGGASSAFSLKSSDFVKSDFTFPSVDYASPALAESVRHNHSYTFSSAAVGLGGMASDASISNGDSQTQTATGRRKC